MDKNCLLAIRCHYNRSERQMKGGRHLPIPSAFSTSKGDTEFSAPGSAPQVSQRPYGSSVDEFWHTILNLKDLVVKLSLKPSLL